jgi:hypothetical protein
MRRHAFGFIAFAVFTLAACKRSTTSTPTAAEGAQQVSTATTASERPLYYDRAIVRADLDGRSLREITLMRNWIYARAGNIFYKRWLNAFFSKQPWYKSTGLDESKLTAIDKQNATAIAEYEAGIPKRTLTDRRDAMMAHYAYALRGAEAAAFSKDSARIASADTKRLALWNAETGQELVGADLPIEQSETVGDAEVLEVAFSPDGKAVAALWTNGRVRIYALDTLALTQTFDIEPPPPGLDVATFTSTEPWRVLVSAEVEEADGEGGPWVELIEMKDGSTVSGQHAPRGEDPGRRREGRLRIPSPDGRRILVVARENLSLVDAKSEQPISTWAGHEPFPSEDVKIELQLLSRSLGLPSPIGGEEQRTPLDDPKLLDGQLTRERLKDVSRRDLRLIRNMIFARHGRTFKSETLTEYFARMDWYHPDPEYTDARLTPLDKRNIKLISSVEEELGGRMSEEEHLLSMA